MIYIAFGSSRDGSDQSSRRRVQNFDHFATAAIPSRPVDHHVVWQRRHPIQCAAPDLTNRYIGIFGSHCDLNRQKRTPGVNVPAGDSERK
jgi:hypothetical protein